MGTLTLRVVAPMIVNGKRIGFVEMGEELYHITAKLKKTIGVDLIVHLHKKFLDRPGWEAGMKMMGRPYDWARFPDVVLLEQTLPVNPETLTKFFSEGSHNPGATDEEIFSQNHRYRYRFLAIKDVQGLAVGDMIVMIDVTSQVTNLYSTMRVIAIFTVFLGGVLFFLFRIFLVRVENQLTTAQQKIIDLEKASTRMESEAKFYSVAQSVNDAMISCDSSGKINFWNPAAAILFGYQEEEVLGQPLTMIMPERYRKAYQKGMERLQSGGDGPLIGKTSELFGLKKDGAEFSMVLSLAQWTAGRNILHGLIRDISERKQAEEELKRNHDIQKVINSLLSLSLQDISLQETLERSLHLILSLPWLAFEAKGSIFLIEKKPEILILKSQQGLAEPIRIACAQIPFGKCLCGRAVKNGKIEYANCIDDRHDISYEGMRPNGHYCVPILYLKQVLGVLNLYIKEGYVSQFYIEEFLIAYANTLAGIIMRKRTEEELHQTMTNLRNAMGGVIKATAATVEARDPSTSGHQQRVSDLARTIAREMGLPAERVDGIRLAAVIHVLGKISVPAEILSKHTKLTDIEFGLIKAHPQIGHDILKDIEFVWPISRMVWEHHERMNGSGYPRGLKGEEILL
ncbi:MAG: PAS domain S-box protein, partial [Syntrophales bacterium LBB04]|nr:PAS domain S-box protein [Syntrophales bacterium LBB04]